MKGGFPLEICLKDTTALLLAPPLSVELHCKRQVNVIVAVGDFFSREKTFHGLESYLPAKK